MKLLIGGKNRNIYMRKDGSAYYKSGGENVDVTHMFKKNGGGLKKQYIGGVQDNLGKVEQKKRSKKGFKQILGGAISNINFDKIEIKSRDIVNGGDYKPSTAPKQLKKICCLALYGLGAAMTGELEVKTTGQIDRIKVLIGENKETFLKHLSKYPTLEQVLGFPEWFSESDDNGEYVTVSRAYILNKILQCFIGKSIDQCIAGSNSVPDVALKTREMIIHPGTGKMNSTFTESTLQNIIKNIRTVADTVNNVDGNDANIRTYAFNLHKVLFIQEKIGAPAADAPASGARGERQEEQKEQQMQEQEE